jgi:hypothetical protein
MMFMAMRLDKAQRGFVADKFMDSVNYVLALLVLGQLVSENVEPLLILLGLLLYLWGWSVSIRLMKGVRKNVKS